MTKPKLRFPEFTDEWKEKQLKDFMFFKNGLNADKDKFGSGIKFISVMDILNNPFITYDVIRGKVNIDEKTLDNYSVTYGDVLFQRSSENRGDAGKSNVYLDKENTATFGGFVIRGKKIGNYSPEFMNSLLKSLKVRKEITSKAQGAQHINVGQETLENVSIILPVIKEQEKIADFLSSIDNIIQVQEEQIAAFEEQKKGILQKFFNREIRFKADDGSEFPAWEKEKLSELLIERKTKAVKDGSHEHVSLTKEGVVPKTAQYNRDFLVKSDDKEYKITKMNDICYNPANLKFGVICRNTYGEGIFSPIYITFEITKKVIPEFMEIMVTRVDFINYALKYQEGTVYERMAVSPEDLLSIEVQIPCLEEQKKIADCLLTYNEAIQIKKDKLEVWKEIKRGLLQQMFV